MLYLYMLQHADKQHIGESELMLPRSEFFCIK